MTNPNGMEECLTGLAKNHSLLRPGDPGYSAYTSDIVMTGHPDAVVRPRDEADVRDILAHAGAHRLPVTPAGGQTSVTGSSVTHEGLLLSTEKMDRVLEIGRDFRTGGMVAVVEPGMFLGDFQRRLEAEGWLYPPDPTSKNEARTGATIATNATGEDSLLYGSTRNWIRELRVVTADGKVQELRRFPGRRPTEEKGTAGYYPGGDPLDLMIGSEGTLGVITRITVDLTPLPQGLFTGLAFFSTTAEALAFVVAARHSSHVVPRALELIDGPCLDLVVNNPEGILWPRAARAAVEFKQEYRDESDEQSFLAGWHGLIESALQDHPEFLDAVIVATNKTGRERLRRFRHRIPAAINELVEGYRKAGGAKVASDCWVPYQELPVFLGCWLERARATGLEPYAFGHAGNGHPHVNFITRSPDETKLAGGLVTRMCQEAVAAGGGVAGEHGLGKLKRHLLQIQYSTERIRAMRDIKKEWDPHWILGRGNLFPVDP